ncbi:mobilization protein A, partial [Acinetobacter ursingii]
RVHAKILQGDPEITRQLADRLEFKQKYTVGVLSFEEKDLDDKTKREIMAVFEKSLLCGLEHDQYDITWIELKDKGRLELNFVIPKVELNTG